MALKHQYDFDAATVIGFLRHYAGTARPVSLSCNFTHCVLKKATRQAGNLIG